MSMSTTEGRIVLSRHSVKPPASLNPAIAFAVRKSMQLKLHVTGSALKETRLCEASIMLSGTAFASSVTLSRRRGEGFLNRQCLWTMLDTLAGHG